MPNFAKAFISHSSKDKPLVERITKFVSAARWEVDSYTFEEGKSSAAEIFKALKRSDLLVLIASKDSIASGWVQSELEVAQHMLYSKELGGVIVFIVDESPSAALPEWIRMYVFAKTANEARIANVIRARLMQIDSEKGVREKPFVQRMNIRGEIERKLADLNIQANGIYVSGVDGIGRRAIVANTLRSLFPGMDVAGIDITMADGEGILEAYRKLYFSWNRPTVEQAKHFLDESGLATSKELVSKTVELVNEISKQKTSIWMQFDYGVLDDDGNFESSFGDLLTALESRRPTLIFRSKRTPRFQQQRKLKNIAFIKVNSLTEEESKLLWIYALEHYEFSGADPKFISFLQDHVSGHPAMIWTAAEHVASVGKAAIEANPRDLLDTLRGLSLSLVDGLDLDEIEKCLLALFDEFGTIDPGDLLQICNKPDQVISTAISKLLSLGMLESEGDNIRLASFFQNARFRKQFSGETDAFLTDARNRLQNITRNYTAEDNISFATIDATVTSSIVLGKAAPIAFGERAIVGSHYLRVARASYDREKHNDAVRFALEALKKKESLTQNAIVETLRLLGMASTRVNNQDGVTRAQDELTQIATQQAIRHKHFIGGFHARWNGNHEAAEREFLEALKINPQDTHALRELAQLLVIKEEFQLAEGYARDALARAPGNPFIIDILVQCLIERKKINYLDLQEDEEIGDLFDQLELADRREGLTFYPLRRANYFSALKRPDEALHWADKAVASNPRQVHAYAVRAEIKLSIKNAPEQLRLVDIDIRQIQNIADESKGVKPHVSLLSKLKIRYELAKGNVAGAVKQYEAVSFNLGALRKKIALEIANEAVRLESKDKDVIAFANRILSAK